MVGWLVGMVPRDVMGVLLAGLGLVALQVSLRPFRLPSPSEGERNLENELEQLAQMGARLDRALNSAEQNNPNEAVRAMAEDLAPATSDGGENVSAAPTRPDQPTPRPMRLAERIAQVAFAFSRSDEMQDEALLNEVRLLRSELERIRLEVEAELVEERHRSTRRLWVGNGLAIAGLALFLVSIAIAIRA